MSLAGYLWAISTTNILLISVAAFVNMSLFFSCYNGVWTSFFAEQFPATVRFTGMAVSNQLGNLLAGFSPMVAALILLPGATGWLPVAVFGAVACCIAGVAVLGLRETAKTPTDLLGLSADAEPVEVVADAEHPDTPPRAADPVLSSRDSHMPGRTPPAGHVRGYTGRSKVCS